MTEPVQKMDITSHVSSDNNSLMAARITRLTPISAIRREE
jgi:hypothetical protein